MRLGVYGGSRDNVKTVANAAASGVLAARAKFASAMARGASRSRALKLTWMHFESGLYNRIYRAHTSVARRSRFFPFAHGRPSQSAATRRRADLRGPLLVLAGAGTGKTRVVTHRIAELIRHGTPAERILAVTFTNKAASEMQQRMATLLGKRLKQRPEISTFHSLCVRVLRRQIHVLGYPKAFAIYDRSDQESIARARVREIKVAAESLRPSELLYFISRWKSSSVRPTQAAEVSVTDKEHLAAAGYRRYQKALRAAGAVDFDDLLILTEELFERFPDIRKVEAARFNHVLIDEYQDTNGSQYRIVKGLVAGHRNLCVVGDDDQSIYGWRGRRSLISCGSNAIGPTLKSCASKITTGRRPRFSSLPTG